MARKPNTNQRGKPFSEEIIGIVWQKGDPIEDSSPSIWRADRCGTIMNRNEYGNRNYLFGWEIDHINPVANNGSDDLENLQPLNWKNNAAKGDRLDWDCN